MYSPSGRRERKFFDTQKEAVAFAKSEKTRVDREGRKAGAVLTAVQREAAAAAFRLIGEESPGKLVEIVEQWKTRKELSTRSKKLGQVFKGYLERGKRKKTRGGMMNFVAFSKKHKRGIEYAEKQLAAHKDTNVCDITRKVVEKALEGCSASYFNAHLRIIRAVFAYAVERKWATENPAEAIEPMVQSRETRAQAQTGADILTIEQTRQLLLISAEAAPQYVPFFAMALFAGIRPDLEDGELVKMTWEMIHLNDRRIVVPESVSKTGSRRVIEMEDVLVDWLRYHLGGKTYPQGPIVPLENLRERMRLVRSLAIIDWKQDLTRHSFASYHLSHFENLARCVASMGHKDSTMLWNHYHAAVPKDVAALYWKITPASLGLT